MTTTTTPAHWTTYLVTFTAPDGGDFSYLQLRALDLKTARKLAKQLLAELQEGRALPRKTRLQVQPV
jgi:hypothetical protein